VLEAEEEHRQRVLDPRSMRQEKHEQGREDERREPGLEEEKNRERHRDDVLGQRESELREAPGRGGRGQSCRGLGRVRAEGDDGRRERDAGSRGPGGKRHGGQRQQGPDDRPQERVNRLPDPICQRDLGLDELREKQHEGELEDERARQERRHGSGEILGQKPDEAVEEEKDRPGVQPGRRRESEPGQDRSHARRRNNRERKPDRGFLADGRCFPCSNSESSAAAALDSSGATIG
jgi:hypothetical protein